MVLVVGAPKRYTVIKENPALVSRAAAHTPQMVEQIPRLQIFHAQVQPLVGLESKLERGNEWVLNLRHYVPLLQCVLARVG